MNRRVNIKQYVSKEEFLKKYAISEKTFNNRINDIPGVIHKNDETLIVYGTRYPFNLRNAKLKDAASNYYIILKAINSYRYIDEKMLKIYRNDFVVLLRELIKANLITNNHSPNTYGANSYNTTKLGMECVSESRKKAIISIRNAIESCVAKIAVEVISRQFISNF